MKSVEELAAFLSNHEQEALEKTGKRNTTTYLQWLTSFTEERAAWKMIFCAFIRSISHISLGPILDNSFYPKKIIKGEPPNIKTRPTSSQQTEGRSSSGSKEEDKMPDTVMREFAGEYGRDVRQ